MKGVSVLLGGSQYSFKTTLDLTEDDYVLVDTSKGIQVAKVYRLTEEPDMAATKFAFQKVNISELENLKLRETRRLAVLAKLEKKLKAEDKRSRYARLAEHDDEAKELLRQLKGLED